MDMKSVKTEQLLNMCTHAVFNVRTTVDRVLNLSFGSSGLSFNMFPTLSPLANFGVGGTLRFCQRIAMTGCVARGQKMSSTVTFKSVWGTAQVQAGKTKFKACHYTNGTNCVAFTLYMEKVALALEPRRGGCGSRVPVG